MTHKGAIVGVVRRLLRPIVRLMIALDFNARDFHEVVKMVYAEIALQEGGKQARVTSASRAARMTGLTRREITRLRRVLEKVPTDMESRMGPLERILMAWYRDPEYLDDEGQPRKLRMGSSLDSLVNVHRGDLPVATLIAELQKHRLIVIDGDDVSVRSPHYLPCEVHMQSLGRFGRVMADLGTTMSNNLLAGFPDDVIFEGCSVTERAVTVSVDEVRNYMDRRALEFLEEMQCWLNDHTDTEATSGPRVGIGVYAIQDLGCIPEPRHARARQLQSP